MKLTFPFSFALLFSATGLAQAATVWSLSDPNVTAVNFTQPTPGIGHEVAPGIILNRDNRRGLYNSATEGIFSFLNSPGGTRWAFSSNNAIGASIQATNHTNLTFGVWADSLGGAGNLQTNILAGPAVLHLTGDDIYLDIQFTAWDRAVSDGGQAGFTLTRASAPVPEPSSSLLATIASAFLLFRRKRR